MKLAPIIMFVFNRPEHTRKALQSLKANTLAKDSKLYIFSDGPKATANDETRAKIKEVRAVLREEQWCGEVEIVEEEVNVGCGNSISQGITATLNKYETVIIIEDDLLVHHDLLSYLNAALVRYADEPQVLTVTGYQYPAHFPDKVQPNFFIDIASSWTWATWRRAWKHYDFNAKGWEEMKTNEPMRRRFNFDNTSDFYSVLVKQVETHEIDTWDVQWYWASFKMKGLHLYPKYSLVENIGFDGSGIHKVDSDVNFSPMLNGDYQPVFPDVVKRDEVATKAIKRFWKLYYHHDLATRIRRRLIKILRGK